MRIYPYIERSIKLQAPKPCEKCTKETITQIEMRETWFVGENEMYILCEQCIVKLENSIETRKKEAAKRANEYHKIQEKNKQDTVKKLKEKYEVKELSPYQWRINGIIDIYPTNERYHLLKVNKRGEYNNLFSFLASKI